MVAPYFYPNIEWGGPVTVVWNITQLLTENGLQVEVLTTDVSSGKVKTKSINLKMDDVKINYAKSLFPLLSWKFRIFLSIDQIIKGWKLIPH